ncbi:endonuclease/exonuclease/phosphatase family protein [Paenimyroides tangerinum]|uniref:Endonuclease/exonuclease/phosphatase family protein n=1 Tax=Paenimyroides tangerinum TaxID=2488728 RepID=A0A3P3WAG3_9FLAO|nr:endonuclease/exonuclease/phosphatase family protein [Paenimyroides tangerinum]RRJ92000.1 endonuclease/exonuclease/phosphatase family protein [Paenimyroides tangerinum]
MKIITWNCNGAFRKKFSFLKNFDADVLVIQECENPLLVKDVEYLNFSNNYVWIGDNKNKGIGIFAKSNIKLERLDLPTTYNKYDVKYFLPVIINDSQILIGVWAHKNNSPTFEYIGQVWKYFQINSEIIYKSIIVGDFNSNSIWNLWDRWWNHSDVVEMFEKNNLVSMYHELENELQGKETIKTFYLHKNINKGYHIDYCFVPKKLINDNSKFIISKFDEFKILSDHVPIIIQI